MTAMATRRDYAWHSLGALGIIELTAPGRSAAVAAGLKRLGVPAKARTYFQLHATLDVKHSEAWNAEAIGPAIAEDPARAVAIAEGALIRLSCGARCFEHIVESFGERPRGSGAIAVRATISRLPLHLRHSGNPRTGSRQATGASKFARRLRLEQAVRSR